MNEEDFDKIKMVFWGIIFVAGVFMITSQIELIPGLFIVIGPFGLGYLSAKEKFKTGEMKK